LALLKQVKGVGPKSAQRIILELQDKLQKTEFGTEKMEFVRGIQTNQEALSALTMLGFSKIASEKAIQSVLSESNNNEDLKVEEIIKLSLKKL
jgi:Holliday junction DNA helicase RuvA